MGERELIMAKELLCRCIVCYDNIWGVFSISNTKKDMKAVVCTKSQN